MHRGEVSHVYVERLVMSGCCIYLFGEEAKRCRAQRVWSLSLREMLGLERCLLGGLVYVGRSNVACGWYPME